MPTDKQKEVAELLGLNVTEDSERVAAAKILDCVFAAIYPDKEMFPSSQEQVDFAKSLGIYIENDSRNILSAKISDELETRNHSAIEFLKLAPGDKVRIRRYGIEEIFEISSIGRNLRLWFKGGCGNGAWPTQVIEKT